MVNFADLRKYNNVLFKLNLVRFVRKNTLNFPQNVVGKLLIDNRDNKQKKKKGTKREDTHGKTTIRLSKIRT